jgi:hypothetical protein
MLVRAYERDKRDERTPSHGTLERYDAVEFPVTVLCSLGGFAFVSFRLRLTSESKVYF